MDTHGLHVHNCPAASVGALIFLSKGIPNLSQFYALCRAPLADVAMSVEGKFLAVEKNCQKHLF